MKNNGFTITELMIVLVLAGIAVGIATPSLSTAFRQAGQRAAISEFISTHALARSVAVRHGRTAELHIDNSTGHFWVEVDTGTTAVVKDTVGVLKDVSRNNVTLNSDRSILCFDSRGLPTTRGSCDSADATLIFTSGTRVDTITITALGRVLR